MWFPLVLKVKVRYREGRAMESEIRKVPGCREGKMMESGVFVLVQSRKKRSRMCFIAAKFRNKHCKGCTNWTFHIKLKTMLFENSLPITQKTRSVFAVMTNHVILFRRKVTLF
jgi:hypothetical protein